MKIIKTCINKGLIITDEHPQSSYGIPVVIYNGKVFGDNDIIDQDDSYCFTGRDAKIQAANESEYILNRDHYEFITKGLGYTSFEDKQKEFLEKKDAVKEWFKAK